jgi:hypothetical protein
MAKKEKELTPDQKKLKAAVEKVNEVLLETNTVLQPYMHRGELFDVPSVRLALKKDTNVANKQA